MNKASNHFERWIPHEKTTWILQVSGTYDSELERNITSFFNAFQYTYASLKANGAKWSDPPRKHFVFSKHSKPLFEDLGSWAKAYDSFENWNNLNILMAISSKFEIYLSSIITLAIQSDPGLLFHSPQSIDGAFYLKHGSFKNFAINSIVESCVKGCWSARWASINKLFPNIPNDIYNHISELEDMRKTRNEVGHALGRDIVESRKYICKNISPVTRLERKKVLNLKSMIINILKPLDAYMLRRHIGEFQFINYYHSIYHEMNMKTHQSIRAIELKKRLGDNQVSPVSKTFAKELVAYYEHL